MPARMPALQGSVRATPHWKRGRPRPQMGVDIQQRISQWNRSNPTQTIVEARHLCASQWNRSNPTQTIVGARHRCALDAKGLLHQRKQNPLRRAWQCHAPTKKHRIWLVPVHRVDEKFRGRRRYPSLQMTLVAPNKCLRRFWLQAR